MNTTRSITILMVSLVVAATVAISAAGATGPTLNPLYSGSALFGARGGGPALVGQADDWGRDAVSATAPPTVTVGRPRGFVWGDFAIGAGAALGVALLLGVPIFLVTGRHDRTLATP